MAKKGVCDLFDPPVICEEDEFCWTCGGICEGEFCPWWAQDYDGEVEKGEQYESFLPEIVENYGL